MALKISITKPRTRLSPSHRIIPRMTPKTNLITWSVTTPRKEPRRRPRSRRIPRSEPTTRSRPRYQDLNLES